jgi:hypothetical protein
MLRPRPVRTSVLLSLVVLALLAAGVAAHAASPAATIKIAPGAALANPPTAVIVTVTYSCLPSAYTFGNVNLDQSQTGSSASGGRFDVFGSGYFQPVCDGKTHRANVVVSSFEGAFVRGVAGASASVDSGAVSASTQAKVKIS